MEDGGRDCLRILKMNQHTDRYLDRKPCLLEFLPKYDVVQHFHCIWMRIRIGRPLSSTSTIKDRLSPSTSREVPIFSCRVHNRGRHRYCRAAPAMMARITTTSCQVGTLAEVPHGCLQGWFSREAPWDGSKKVGLRPDCGNGAQHCPTKIKRIPKQRTYIGRKLHRTVVVCPPFSLVLLLYPILGFPTKTHLNMVCWNMTPWKSTFPRTGHVGSTRPVRARLGVHHRFPGQAPGRALGWPSPVPSPCPVLTLELSVACDH